MKASFTAADRSRIEKAIREKYAKAARSLDGLFRYPTGRAGLESLRYPTGRAGLESLRYDPLVMSQLPQRVLASYCGAGKPSRWELSAPDLLGASQGTHEPQDGVAAG